MIQCLTTADKIDRPERALEKQAIDDFMKRNPMAGGGQGLVEKKSLTGEKFKEVVTKSY